LTHDGKVVLHVCRHDKLDDSLAQGHAVGLRQVRQEVVFRPLEQCKSGGKVVVFKG